MDAMQSILLPVSYLRTQESDVGLYTNMQLTVFDGVNFTSTEEFTIEVSSPNEQPTSPIPSQSFSVAVARLNQVFQTPMAVNTYIITPQFGNVQINENLVIYRADSINK